MYRKEIKVLDCTVRDGGLQNKWQFSDKFVKAVYDACVEAGVDYMEIGYKSSEHAYSKTENGPWKFCEEKDLKRIVGENKTNLKLAAMADIGRIDFNDIAPKSESLLDMIRVACYDYQVDKGIALAEHCMDKGYEVCLNLMAVSAVSEMALDQALSDIAKSKIPTVYLVDSFGSMYSEQIHFLMTKYKKALPGKTIGFHGHNNMQLAFANTIETIIEGANMLDGTFLGLGRGAGNCGTEQLLTFLKNPKYRVKPVFNAIQHEIIPLQKTLSWGYHIPYLITGYLNLHPSSAMKWMDSDERDDFMTFFENTIDSRKELE
jgi:4-hydroxy 2-oxovalerate aldolase